MIGILIIAHAPLATALRECALHVFPDCASGVLALDVLPHDTPEDTLTRAREAMAAMWPSSWVMGCTRAWWPGPICPCCCAACATDTKAWMRWPHAPTQAAPRA